VVELGVHADCLAAHEIRELRGDVALPLRNLDVVHDRPAGLAGDVANRIAAVRFPGLTQLDTAVGETFAVGQEFRMRRAAVVVVIDEDARRHARSFVLGIGRVNFADAAARGGERHLDQRRAHAAAANRVGRGGRADVDVVGISLRAVRQAFA